MFCRTVGRGYESVRGGSRDHGRSRGRDDRPCEAKYRDGEGTASVRHGGESDGGHAHGQNQIAMRQMGECVPTEECPLDCCAVRVGRKQDEIAGVLPTSIFNMSSRPMRLLCMSWYASSASRRSSYSTKAKLRAC